MWKTLLHDVVKIFQYIPSRTRQLHEKSSRAVLQHSCDDHTLHGIFLPKDSYIRLKKVEKLQTLATSGHLNHMV
jgi:hypothetical protein